MECPGNKNTGLGNSELPAESVTVYGAPQFRAPQFKKFGNSVWKSEKSRLENTDRK